MVLWRKWNNSYCQSLQFYFLSYSPDPPFIYLSSLNISYSSLPPYFVGIHIILGLEVIENLH